MPEETFGAGLLAEGKPVPLEGIRVEGRIFGPGARVVLTQRYRNVEDRPIEAVYVFPIDEAAAVCGFEALIDDVLVTGRVMERDKAFESYDDASRGSRSVLAGSGTSRHIHGQHRQCSSGQGRGRADHLRDRTRV